MKIFFILATSLLVVGCSSGDSDEHREETVGAEIANDYNRQMQKAADVEIQLQNQKRDLDAAIEESDQGRRQP
jgi:hypothetical protein